MSGTITYRGRLYRHIFIYFNVFSHKNAVGKDFKALDAVLDKIFDIFSEFGKHFPRVFAPVKQIFEIRNGAVEQFRYTNFFIIHGNALSFL